MKGGRKPVPTALKLIRGNPGKRALPKNEPTPPVGAQMPEWLSEDAKAHWPLVAEYLTEARVLTRMDGHALGLYCEAFARWKHATDQVVKFGPLVKTPNGYPVQSPYLQIANRAWEQMAKMLIEFGMTPSSRARVSKAPDEPEKHAKTGLASFLR